MQIQDWQRKTITQTVRWYLKRKRGFLGITSFDALAYAGDVEGELYIQIAQAWETLEDKPERELVNYICRILDRRCKGWMRQYRSCGNNTISDSWGVDLIRDEQEPQCRAQAESLADRAVALLRQHGHTTTAGGRDSAVSYFMGDFNSTPYVITRLRQVCRQHYPEHYHRNRKCYDIVQWIRRHSEFIPSMTQHGQDRIRELLKFGGSARAAQSETEIDRSHYDEAMRELSELATRANSSVFLDMSRRPGRQVRAV